MIGEQTKLGEEQGRHISDYLAAAQWKNQGFGVDKMRVPEPQLKCDQPTSGYANLQTSPFILNMEVELLSFILQDKTLCSKYFLNWKLSNQRKGLLLLSDFPEPNRAPFSYLTTDCWGS